MYQNPNTLVPSDTSDHVVEAADPLNLALNWLQRVSLLNAKVALQLGVMLMQQQTKYPDRNLHRIFPVLLKRYKIPRTSAYSALNTLHEAGLIRVSRNHGESPIVQVLWGMDSY